MVYTDFLVQIKRTNGTYEKGVVVKAAASRDAAEAAAKQSYHAYFGTYGFNHDPTTDYVLCYIIDDTGAVVCWELDDRRPREEEQ
jgi:hypothetical protein